jgi:hypothetical protein
MCGYKTVYVTKQYNFTKQYATKRYVVRTVKYHYGLVAY